jgi:hypothetical protein
MVFFLPNNINISKSVIFRGGKKLSRAADVSLILNRVHHAMDSQNTKYGYILAVNEILFLRRRGTGWGHLDISTGFPFFDNDKGAKIFSLDALICFYWHIAMDKELWAFHSSRKRKSPTET